MKYAEDFRYEARGALNGRWGVAIGTGFVAGLLGVGSNSFRVPNSNFEWRNNDFLEYGVIFLPIFLGVLSFVVLYALVTFFLGGAITLGYCRFNKNLVNGTNPQFRDLFSNFHIFWKGFALQFMTGLLIFLWSLLFLIPGIIAGYRYAMAPYILDDNPDMPVMEAISRSKEMMVGNKWRLFCLNISFIGWSLLSLLTCGIGYLWLVPYVNAAQAAFYNEVSGRSDESYLENPPWFTN